jgi:hypothetical protein
MSAHSRHPGRATAIVPQEPRIQDPEWQVSWLACFGAHTLALEVGLGVNLKYDAVAAGAARISSAKEIPLRGEEQASSWLLAVIGKAGEVV